MNVIVSGLLTVPIEVKKPIFFSSIMLSVITASKDNESFKGFRALSESTMTTLLAKFEDYHFDLQERIITFVTFYISQ